MFLVHNGITKKLIRTIGSSMTQKQMRMRTVKEEQVFENPRYTLDKFPLGKLTKSHITRGYLILSKIEKLLNAGPRGRDEVIDLSNEFYSLIPQYFGRKVPQPINNLKYLNSRKRMIESLTDIQIATEIIEQSGSSNEDKNPLDGYYNSLKLDMNVVPRDSEDFEWIEKYLLETRAPTHRYTVNLSKAYEVSRNGENESFKQKLSNKQMLWHGSRMSNFVGILSQGLRIAPPEAPTTGYMFGKGVYFAESSTKSANYTHYYDTENKGIMLLCEVALGKSYELTGSEYVDKLAKGFHSTKGIGRSSPDPSGHFYVDGDVLVPCGELIDNKEVQSSLLYNEYIVYNTSQVKIRYLLVLDFSR